MWNREVLHGALLIIVTDSHLIPDGRYSIWRTEKE